MLEAFCVKFSKHNKTVSRYNLHKTRLRNGINVAAFNRIRLKNILNYYKHYFNKKFTYIWIFGSTIRHPIHITKQKRRKNECILIANRQKIIDSSVKMYEDISICLIRF